MVWDTDGDTVDPATKVAVYKIPHTDRVLMMLPDGRDIYLSAASGEWLIHSEKLNVVSTGELENIRSFGYAGSALPETPPVQGYDTADVRLARAVAAREAALGIRAEDTAAGRFWKTFAADHAAEALMVLNECLAHRNRSLATRRMAMTDWLGSLHKLLSNRPFRLARFRAALRREVRP